MLWAHVAGIPIFAGVRGYELPHALMDTLPVAVLAVAASYGGLRISRGARSMAVAVALLMSSAILVHLSGGMIEMHFHFFVMVGLITLYQDWLPFLAAIAFVALHHGVLGVLAPRGVFSHEQAWESPWKWAGIHALFVLAASAAQLTSWRVVEQQHERSERELRKRERRFRALIENSSDVVSIVGADGVISYDSPSVTRVLGYAPGEREGQSARQFVHPDDLARIEAAFMNDGASQTWVEVRVRHADSSWRWAEVYITDARTQRGIEGVVVNLRDTTERKALEDRLAHQAFHDPLTGLANRALFHDRVEHALAANRRRPERQVAVLYLDLDDFKTINDALGHAAGDQVLVEMGARLQRCVRPGDTCARLGGDEFAILLENIDNPGEAYDVGVRVLDTLRDPITVEGNTLSLNASVGVVVQGSSQAAAGSSDAVEIVRNADLAMYKAKGGGKGRFEIFEQGMHEAVVERLEMKADMRRAVEDSEFVLHYQPVVDLVSGEAIGAEALMRWDHPTKGLLPPGAFIELAEETGLIVRMGRDLLLQACTDATSWPDGPAGPRSVSVNMSVRQLQDPGVIDDVRTALVLSGLDPARLTLEITESLLIADPDGARSALAALKALGVVLALDDFGTGYSSLSYLGRFPVDALKIDRSFVAALQAGGVDSALVSAIVGLGRTLDMKVTAEGIEQASQVRGLLGLGCRLGQGFHFARPMPCADLAELWGVAPAAEGAEAPVAPAGAELAERVIRIP